MKIIKGAKARQKLVLAQTDQGMMVSQGRRTMHIQELGIE